MDSATLQAIKSLTTKKSLVKVKYFEIEKVPVEFSIQKIVSFLRNQGNLNFIFFLQKRWDQNSTDDCSWIIGCRNSSEFNQFLWQFKDFSIEECTFSINPVKKDLEVRFAKSNVQLSSPINILKLKSLSYNHFFPSERMMEIIIECDTNEVLNKVDGIILNYKHATRMLSENIYISTFQQNGVSSLQESFSKWVLVMCHISMGLFYS
ncbi:hypothetical protein ACKWTF_000018 [Chironomus riparius]